MSKLEEEKQIVKEMIRLYCKKKHKDDLCFECMELLEYALKKIDKCKYQENKSFCSNCKTKCYQKQQQYKIREIMRYSGPRMLIRRPILAIRHIYYRFKESKNDRN